ncbi:hypothetical protein SPRG_09998 [Saprolegnia parasitica CBS 223.65]|uniref:Uncharacterized protein n=1 Tax=Saprolegnia parasitica (strain CBS 223.65) TaxID=695850 RepID=A0A067C268_SAPPC|nr:hypothetical protein SPRG_09998 [Saprolegnia parasitica CBS 223.65]KDO23190.1 hypothetical protein SPRG_09998 [Saprolegnia parasitica CBS 223.65]|eukprot:XP_012206141.1 hypothetical protein SPRG_09998 [Saprolegnia parasitica CBS 223.65]
MSLLLLRRARSLRAPVRAMSTSAPDETPKKPSSPSIVLDEFVMRQFDDANFRGTQVKYDKTKFEAMINKYYENGEYALVDGYAPFCKHLFVPNFINARVQTVPITHKSIHLLQSGYTKRRPEELPVLMRWFPSHSVTPVTAKFLDIVLYSREQVFLENEAMGKDIALSDAPWRITNIIAQDVDTELPMEPMHYFRNALGKGAGGSGVPIDPIKYQEAVEYWNKHAHIK